MFQPILQEIQSRDTIILHRHNRPDGDAMGSQIGLKHILKENFPNKNIYAVGDDAGFFTFMDDALMDDIPDSTYEGAIAIILDCGGVNIISDDRYRLAARTCRIDHHIFSGRIADVEVIDTSFESCCGMITQLAAKSGLKLNKTAAKSLYTGMVTDSGRFRYDSTSPRTFRLASLLLEQEFNTDEIFRNLYADTYENKKQKAQFLLRAQFTAKRIAYVITTKEELSAMNMSTFTVSRAMVNTLADIKGTEIWANFTETDEGIFCELRSVNRNIQPVAVKYGGGGHPKACGRTVPDFNTVMAILRDLDDMIGENL